MGSPRHRLGRAWVFALVVAAACGRGGTTAPSGAADRSAAAPSPAAASPSARTASPGPTARTTPAAPQPQAAPSADGAACRYAFPVRAPGAVHYGSTHHDYPATDIMAPAGSDVVAPTDGVVDYVSRTDPWVPKVDDPATRGGLSVAIVGDDGVRYYGSHLEDVAPGLEPGVRVEPGRLLGHVGRTGNARGGPYHLHFGLSHPTTPEDWAVRRGEVSPYRYLNAWKEGKGLTPQVPGALPAKCRPA